MNNFFPALNDTIVQPIIDLAKQRATVAGQQYPDGITFGETKILPTAPEETALQAAISALPQDVAKDLSALMYLGRDGVEDQTVAEAVQWQRDDAAEREDKYVKESLYSKVPLGDYLEKGLQIIQSA